MKNRFLKIVALAVCLSLCLGLFSGCGERDKVKECISSFESACQQADVEGIVACLDPNTVRPITSVMGLFGLDVQTISGLVYAAIGFGMLGSMADYTEMTDFMSTLSSIEITPRKFEFNEDKDACDVLVTLSITQDGQENVTNGTLTCVLRDGEWYIKVS